MAGRSRGSPLQPVVALAALALVGCGRPAAVATPDAGAAPDAQPTESAATLVRFDAEGIALPDPEKRALGVAVPIGFRPVGEGYRFVTYSGRLPADKVLAFYRRYLDSAYFNETRTGWSVESARPLPPGDESRRVSVSIQREGARGANVVVFDRTPPPGSAEPARQDFYERVIKSGHGGVDLSKRPIPGTY